MATTTNFGWETPDDTDLVKDGALAIRTLGNSIDTSLVDLKGGTTGQVLSKTSNTDMDFTWVAQDDSNAIQNAIVDAKGDLITATAADTPARLAVGTNGHVLTADSTTATGLKWASAASSFKGVYCTKSAAQSIPATTYTAITWDTESFDTDAFHSTSTNTSRITIPSGLAGYYSIYYQLSAGNGDLTAVSGIAKNGTRINSFQGWKSVANGTGGYSSNLILNLAVGDYIEALVYATNTLQIDSNAQNSQPSVFWAVYLGA